MSVILLADDDAAGRFTLAALLEDEGFEVLEAESAAQTAELLREHGERLALVVLDHNLGDGFGLDLVPEARRHAPQGRVMLLSGASPGELAASATVDAFATKAGDPAEIVARIRSLTQR